METERKFGSDYTDKRLAFTKQLPVGILEIKLYTQDAKPHQMGSW
jgi:hypothetical protein